MVQPIKPHRKGPYRRRTRVYVRVDDASLMKIDKHAAELSISRSHWCDLALGVSVESTPTGVMLRRRLTEEITGTCTLGHVTSMDEVRGDSLSGPLPSLESKPVVSLDNDYRTLWQGR